MGTIKDIFLFVLNMSLTATFVAVIVISIRLLLLKRLPKFYVCFLWWILLFRLISPVSMTNNFSLMNIAKPAMEEDISISYLHDNISTMPLTKMVFHSDISYDSITPDSHIIDNADIDWNFNIILIASIVWLLGIVVLVVYNMISYIKTLSHIRTATICRVPIINDIKKVLKIKRDIKIYETDMIDSPFVCGILTPRIYIPVSIDECQFPYILTHECVHIKRKDYIIKPFSYLLLIMHWFNPLVWVAIKLFNQDIEMACDEKVISISGENTIKEYSHTLLSFGIKKKVAFFGLYPSFGKSHLVVRINHILKFRKRSISEKILVTMFVVGIGFCLITNPSMSQAKKITQDWKGSYTQWSDIYEDYFYKGSKIEALEVKEPKYDNPVSMKVISKDYDVDNHVGIDILAYEGEMITAVESGRVSFVGEAGSFKCLIKIDHGNGYETWYGNCKEVKVKETEEIVKGEPIAVIGSEGTGPHLHFSIIHKGEFLNPKEYMDVEFQ
ncbi:M23/M56 family metallopeptidase [Vallitalea maricola]|uniref:Uncharacterized protein n=1 Tax=Vallitalea maricola TaxID=3074433 RepID=A0ACB5UDG0_9FIRM|nr:hypothetical protein AN2V17_01980 [Vallitalea sp. AN17-2]